MGQGKLETIDFMGSCWLCSQQHKSLAMVLLGWVKVHLVQCPTSDSGCPVRQRQNVAPSSTPPLPTVFNSGYFLSWMFLEVNSTEFFSVCCPSPPWWPLQRVPQVCSLVLKLSLLNWILFVAAYISENWWTTDAMGIDALSPFPDCSWIDLCVRS